jgi:hypothetical protein
MLLSLIRSPIVDGYFALQTVIRPVTTYGSETGTLTKSGENSLKVFERKILRKIYGPYKRGINGVLDIMKN